MIHGEDGSSCLLVDAHLGYRCLKVHPTHHPFRANGHELRKATKQGRVSLLWIGAGRRNVRPCFGPLGSPGPPQWPRESGLAAGCHCHRWVVWTAALLVSARPEDGAGAATSSSRRSMRYDDEQKLLDELGLSLLDAANKSERHNITRPEALAACAASRLLAQVAAQRPSDVTKGAASSTSRAAAGASVTSETCKPESETRRNMKPT